MEQRFCCIDPSILKMKNKFDESQFQGSGDSLYYKDVWHKEFKTLISEPHLGAE